MAATERTRSLVRRPTASIGNIKRRIGYDTEDDDIHDMRRGIVNMAMNIDVGLPDSDDLGILHLQYTQFQRALEMGFTLLRSLDIYRIYQIYMAHHECTLHTY